MVESLINQTIGNYRVTSLLGEGGMGVVYLAEHPVIGRKVAIKLLHSVLARDQDIVARFFNEARAIHIIAHENIVEVLDFGQTSEGQPYFIMEYLTGESLGDAIARGPMAADRAVAIGAQMCRALGAAHEKGIVHRDLKPHNVHLVIRPDGSLLVKILDFGVAKVLASPDGESSVKTRTGSLMGTPLYMSPEQCKGTGLLDHRTDIYSLGVMLFEMLAGRPPFTAEGVGELFAKHMLEEPPQLIDFAPETPPYMAAAIMKALAKDPEARFKSMDDFRRALIGEIRLAGAAPNSARRAAAASTMAQTISSRASTTLSSASTELEETFERPARRKRLVLGGTVLALAAGVVFFATRSKPSSSTPPPASAAQSGAAVQPAAGSPSVAPAPPSMITIRFEADPPGAHVFSKADDKDLGVVPLEIQLPRDERESAEQLTYVFRLPGYRDKTLLADAAEDHTFHVSLEKVPATADASKRPARHRGGSKRPKTPIDEDGLATPSF